jgi:D-xylose 1-dehydrogenase
MEGMSGKHESQYARYPSLEGRVVLVTGGATGIGESIVRTLRGKGRGWRSSTSRMRRGGGWRNRCGEGCVPPLYIHCDLTDVAALRRGVAEVMAALGRVDVLVNNAANDQRHTIEEVTPEYWDKSMAVNLRPQFFMIQAVLPAMRRGGARIDYQYVFNLVDDSVDGAAALHHGEGGDCGDDSDAGA